MKFNFPILFLILTQLASSQSVTFKFKSLDYPGGHNIVADAISSGGEIVGGYKDPANSDYGFILLSAPA